MYNHNCNVIPMMISLSSVSVQSEQYKLTFTTGRTHNVQLIHIIATRWLLLRFFIKKEGLFYSFVFGEDIPSLLRKYIVLNWTIVHPLTRPFVEFITWVCIVC